MTATPRPHAVLYAGSFDPMTSGHLDVLARARRLFNEVVLGIGVNPEKQALFSPDDRLGMARRLVEDLLADEPDGARVKVERYTGLTVDFARSVGASAILRGIRNVTDLDRECRLAITNRQVADMETVFVVADEKHVFTSSTLIRQVAALGGDLERLAPFVPPLVMERLAQLRDDPEGPLARIARDGLVD